MTRFSERFGFSQPKLVQLEDMDDDLRNRLWTLIHQQLWSRYVTGAKTRKDQSSTLLVRVITRKLWCDFLKKPIDEMGKDYPPLRDSTANKIRKEYFEWPWTRVYEFIEFLAAEIDRDSHTEFASMANKILNEENSAYRFIEGTLAPISDQQEIEALEAAIDNSYENVRSHLIRSVELLSDKSVPDYNNCIKEATGALEAMCRHIVSSDSASLGDAIKKIDKMHELHPAFKQAVLKLYGYASDESGIRHANVAERRDALYPEAKFVLVVSSAIINYLSGSIVEMNEEAND